MILLFWIYIGYVLGQRENGYYQDILYNENSNYIDIWNEKINMEGKVCTKVRVPLGFKI